jgi:hypothetical protein
MKPLPAMPAGQSVSQSVSRMAGSGMARRLRAALTVALGSVLLAACAAAPWRTSSVWIETTSGGAALPGASCTVSNGAFSRVITTPDTIVVPNQGDLHLVCSLQGYQTIDIVQPPAFDTAPASNGTLGIGIGGGGRVGLGIGLNLPIGGSGQGGGYPQRFSLDMRPQGQ